MTKGLASLMLVIASALALQPQQPQQPVFHTEANYVRVDVYPTANGVPVGDLQQADFELLEDGKPQKIDQFEHVEIGGHVSQDVRHEPSSVAESRAMLESSRARVFVLFLDAYHVGGMLALAPLAVGDYVIELAGGAGGAGGEHKRTLVAFRVVP